MSLVSFRGRQLTKITLLHLKRVQVCLGSGSMTGIVYEASSEIENARNYQQERG